MIEKKFLFIINPTSGTKRKKHLPQLINKYVAPFHKTDILFTTYAGEATEIATGKREDYDAIIAVGGDGTINEIANALINTETALGIIPMGSGNGLARHLGISMNTIKALKDLSNGEIQSIDSITTRGGAYVNVGGIGFDAHIANLFANSTKRGFNTYAQLVLKEIRNFKPCDYAVTIDGTVQYIETPLLISIANSSQYGNNAKIVPEAHIADGYLDICILQQLPHWQYPNFLVQLFNGTLNKSRYYQHIKAKEVTLIPSINTNKNLFHADGDIHCYQDSIDFKINPASLKVIY